jgi:HPt (histidine-containing phosphotransfer) domain-containing protein
MNAAPCLDSATMDKLLAIGGKEFAIQMIDLFLEYVPQKLAEGRAAAQAGNWVGVQKAVHPIKSSAGNIGARPMRDLAEHIEQLAIDQRGETIREGFAKLEAAYAEVQTQLQVCRRELRT